jgi:hypothetical protein
VNKEYLSLGFPPQDIRSFNSDLVDSFDPNYLFAPSDSRITPAHTNTLYLLQIENSPGSLQKPLGQHDRWQSGNRDRHTDTEELSCRRFGFPSQPLGSSEFSTENSTLRPTNPPLDNSTDIQSNGGTSDTTEFEEVVSDSAENRGDNIFRDINKSTPSIDITPRKEIIQAIPAKSHPLAGSHISAKFSSLKDSTNSYSPVMILVEDTNDTQQEVQDILAKANQQMRSQKARSSSNSPSRKAATTWEHTFVVQNEFAGAATEPRPERPPKKLGRRRGPLEYDTKERAREMRKIGSCLRCRISKIAVSCKVSLKG